MKAIVLNEYGDSNKLALQEIAEPKPGPGEIKVKVAAAGLNLLFRTLFHHLFATILHRPEATASRFRRCGGRS
jgi:hypothetical protein